MSRPAPSLTARLAALFALSSTVLLLALGSTIYLASDRHFAEQDAHDLHGRAQVIANVLALENEPNQPAALDAVLVSHHELAVMLIGQDGKTIYARSPEVFSALRSNIATVAENPMPHAEHPGKLLTFPYDGHTWRAIALPANQRGAAREIWLAIGISHHTEFLANLLRWLLLGGAAAALLSGGLGVWVARRGLAPLQKISANATLISAQHLATRLDEENMPRELLPLVRELNAMLARLDDAFRRLSEFSSDLAHELRTPVSNLVTQTEVALTRARSNAEYRDVLSSNLEEFGHLRRMIGDMLFLARADHGLMVPERRRVDLGHEVDELISFYEALAEERQLRLRRAGDASTRGDPLMLRRAIANLLSNAIRHATPETEVLIRLATGGHETSIEVGNQGSPIATEHLPRLFDRFYRADFARQHQHENTGLGLAIVKSIVEAHGGTVAVSSDRTGTRFCLTLPDGHEPSPGSASLGVNT